MVSTADPPLLVLVIIGVESHARSVGEQKGRKIVTKRENWQNRYFRVVDGPQPFIAWHKDQKVRQHFGATFSRSETLQETAFAKSLVV